MKRTVAGYLALLVASACTTSSGPAPTTVVREGDVLVVSQDLRLGLDARDDFSAGVEALEGGDAKRAVERLSEVVEAAPYLVAGHIDLAMAYRQLEELEDALASIERAVELSPRHPVAHNEHGMILRRLGRFEEARASYERALDVASDFHFARRNLAILCDLFLNDLGCALDHYERYVQDVPGDEQVGIWVADVRDRVSRDSGGAR